MSRYRERLNSRPAFFHAYTSYKSEVHACKKGRPKLKRLRYYYLICCKIKVDINSVDKVGPWFCELSCYDKILKTIDFVYFYIKNKICQF